MSNPRLSRRGLLSAALAAAVPGRLFASSPRPTRHVSWLALVQQPPAAVPEPPRALGPLLVDQRGQRITTLDQWQARRQQLRRWWLDFLHPLPRPAGWRPKVEVIAEDRSAGVLRQLVRYEAEPGEPTEAYLLQPLQLRGRVPGAVVFHSTVPHSIRQPAGVEGKPEKAFGLKLAQRGSIAFCPRNFLWPTNQRIAARQQTARFHQRHPECKGMAKMLYDARLALDLLLEHPHVDPARIGAVGHSLGAKEVLYLAAMDERVKVTVSSEGGIGTSFSNWDAPWYLGPEIPDALRGHEHHELLALVAPRPFLLVGGDSADGARSWPLIEAALAVYRLYGQPAPLGLLNHGKGHNVPPEAERRIYQWLTTYLPVEPGERAGMRHQP